MNAPVLPRRIVIAGGGTAGWMAAAAIARTLGRVATVTLVVSDAIGTIGVGESTIPPLVAYNRLLGINEAEFMRATRATFKLGIQFENWKNVGEQYFHSFGGTGQDHWSAGFQHFWMEGRARGHEAPYGEYCLELKAAEGAKFAHLPSEGWQWRIPLQHRQGNGIVYASAHLEREAALDRLLSSVAGERLVEPNFIRYQTGARRLQWSHNCVAVGLSGGFMEPLESTSIHLIQRAVLRILRMLPAGEISPRDVAEFNEQQATDMVQIRDFLILHYKVTDRRDSAFWRQCANMTVPATLEQKIELFRDTGRVFRKNEELFAENSWIQVMMGQGIMPRSWHPVAAKLNDEELAGFLKGIRDNVRRQVDSLPLHDRYIEQYCGERPAAVSSRPPIALSA